MTDQYIGIDLHKALFQACAVTATGERLWEGRFPRTPAGMEALTAQCTARSAVAVEASTPTWHFADEIGGAVLRIVDPLKTKPKAGYAAKTDELIIGFFTTFEMVPGGLQRLTDLPVAPTPRQDDIQGLNESDAISLVQRKCR